MPTFNSQQLIADLQKQTEEIVNKVITEWQMLSPQTMLYKQSEDEWSATQCLMHLNSYGDYYLPALQKSIAYAEQKGWHSAINFTSGLSGNWFTNLMLPKGEEKKIKK